MVSDLTSLPNIGKTLAIKLITAGINSYEDLKELGSIKTVQKSAIN